MERSDRMALGRVLLSAWLLLALLWVCPLRAGIEVAGREYVSAREIGKPLGASFSWLEKGEVGVLRGRQVELRLEKNQRYVTLNGIRVYMGFPVVEEAGNLFVSKADFQNNLAVILFPKSRDVPPVPYKIMLDPGHGGQDPGAKTCDGRFVEKQLTLDLAIRLRQKLRDLGYAVGMTRTSDKFIKLEDRTEIANRQNVDLFVSLHFNATGTASVNGVETFCFTPRGQPSSSRGEVEESDKVGSVANRFDRWNPQLAYAVQTRLVRELKADDRGLKRARFTVLKELDCPGILIEGGFLSNPADASSLATAAYRERLATAIANGIVAYTKNIENLNK